MGDVGGMVLGVPLRYRAPVPVASGGMGDVYRAEDAVLGRVVAVKVLGRQFMEQPEALRRFRREAAAAARLSGEPNVVAVYDFGEADGAAYIVMEWCSNGNVLDYVGRHDIGVSRILAWLGQAATGLDAAHQAGLVHRDVKPANLLLDGRCQVKVADFGIARMMGDDTGITVAGTVLGTAGYMSPEQACGEPATAASDRYALAVIAFELLAGQRPFQSNDELAEAHAQSDSPVPRIADMASVPAAANGVFERALAKRPTDRYATASEFVSVLAAALKPRSVPANAASASRQSAPIRRYGVTPRSATRGILVLGGATVAVLLGVGGAFLATRPSPRASAPLIVTRTITAQGTTRVVTRRVPAPPPATLTITSSATTLAVPPSASVGDAHQLNDRGFALINQGRYAQAVPLLRRAAAGLRGVGPGDPYQAYANYNLGYALLQLGDCNAAIAPLTLADHLETAPAVDTALARAHQCA